MAIQKIDTIYLIDDDNITNFINTRLIKRLGVTENLLVSLNGKEALQQLQTLLDEGKESPQVILLDINMPVMDGFEFVEKFQKMPFPNIKDVIIYMLTTSENSKDLEKVSSNSLIAGFFNKPLTDEKIRKIMNTHFRS